MYKKEEKIIEKPKAIERGKLLVEENLIKIMLEDKKYREIILLKINKEDFLEKDSKEILNWLIKNKDLDKITIDKIKSLNISEEYIKGLESISLDNLDLNNIKNIDEIIKNIKKNSLNEKINILLKEQIDIEKNKDGKDVKEVDSKIMEIALKIVELRRELQRL
jgi:DNA primase